MRTRCHRAGIPRYLECGILAHGFARARCADCRHDFLVAYSCKCRDVCPSCTTRRIVETAAHLADHVIPRLPVRQWVFSVSKRLRYRLEGDSAVLNTALGIFLTAIDRVLRQHSPGASAASNLGAVIFIHRRIGNPMGFRRVWLTPGVAVNRRFPADMHHDLQNSLPNCTPSTPSTT